MVLLLPLAVTYMGEAASVAPAPAITYGAAPAMTHSAPPIVTHEAPPPPVALHVTYMGGEWLNPHQHSHMELQL